MIITKIMLSLVILWLMIMAIKGIIDAYKSRKKLQKAYDEFDRACMINKWKEED